ncbi:tetratricopeptide repeat protein [Ruegeria hyattellae]|uniref:tetratricopeptide repeat protein n=1 Tax=Ruegeria hyattellae TaxID=3233337 RepID=UPI00355C3FCC
MPAPGLFATWRIHENFRRLFKRILSHATVASTAQPAVPKGISNLKRPPDTKADQAVSGADARAALELLALSSGFSGSDRLLGFLRYVVEEELQGRGDLIRAKSIALDVYGYEPDEIERRESVVRVDAGRIRRKLEEYYEGEGLDALVRIDLPKGRYIPVFHSVQVSIPGEDSTTGADRKRRKHLPPGGALVGIALLAIGIWQYQSRLSSFRGAGDEAVLRTVLFDTSPQRLQSVNLAKQGRDLIFPAINPDRLQAALLIFESAMQIDETYEGGYAGASQVQGLMSLLTADKAKSESLLGQSKSLSKMALDRSPTSAWAISARAWAEFASGNYDEAMSWSDKARQIDPLNPHVLEFNALIFLYSGEFERVINDTSQMLTQTDGDAGFVFRNARAASYFHMEDYLKSIKDFEVAIAKGAPMGPVPVAYMMAANQYLGQEGRASELVRKYETNWPNQRVDLLFSRLFENPEFSEQLAKGMYAAGWNPN